MQTHLLKGTYERFRVYFGAPGATSWDELCEEIGDRRFCERVTTCQ